MPKKRPKAGVQGRARRHHARGPLEIPPPGFMAEALRARARDRRPVAHRPGVPMAEETPAGVSVVDASVKPSAADFPKGRREGVTQQQFVFFFFSDN